MCIFAEIQRQKLNILLVQVDDDGSCVLIEEFETARILRDDVLPRVACVYANHYLPQHVNIVQPSDSMPYTQGEVTSHNLWSQRDRHFVGITWLNVCSRGAKIYRVIGLRICPHDH